MGYGAIAGVLAGWTGVWTMTSNGVTSTLTPETRESAASLVARMIEAAFVDQGLTLTASLSASGVITLSADALFAMTFDGNCGDRVGFNSSPYGAGGPHEAEQAYIGVWVPTIGLWVNGVQLAQAPGRAVSDGTFGVAGALGLGTVPLHIETSFADAWAKEATITGMADVWQDGRVFARGRIDRWRRTRKGARADIVQLDAELRGAVE